MAQAIQLLISDMFAASPRLYTYVHRHTYYSYVYNAAQFMICARVVCWLLNGKHVNNFEIRR